MSIQKPIGDPKALQKPIPSSTRYGGVEAVVDTGMSVPLAQLAKSQSVSTKAGRDELFRRLRPSTVATIVERRRVEEATAEDAPREPPTPLPEHRELIAEAAARRGGRAPSERPPPTPPPARASKPPRAPGPAEVAPKIGRPPEAPPAEDPTAVPVAQRRVLLLDVREREAFEACHIVSAIHFAPTRLNHATNPFSAEVLQYRNRPDCAIVLYDLDEDIVVGQRIANLFFERGIDNVYIMAGGLRAFVQDFHVLCTGPPPVPIVEKSARLTIAHESSVRMSKWGGGSSVADSRAGGSRPKPLASSLAKPSESDGAGPWK